MADTEQLTQEEQDYLNSLPEAQRKAITDGRSVHDIKQIIATAVQVAQNQGQSQKAGLAYRAASSGNTAATNSAGGDQSVLTGTTGGGTVTSQGVAPTGAADPYAAYGQTDNDVMNTSIGNSKVENPSWQHPKVDERNRPIYNSQVGKASHTESATIGSILTNVGRLSPEKLKQYQEALYKGGYYGDKPHDAIAFGRLDEATTDAFIGLFMQTKRVNDGEQKNGDQLSTWDDVLKLPGPEKNQSTEPAGPKLTPAWTHTDKQFDVADPGSVRQVMDAALQQALGRNPTDGEREDFLAAVQHAYKANPQVQQTHYSGDHADGTPGNTTTTVMDAGLTNSDVANMALDTARQMPDYGAYQAATTYFNALVNALGSPVN